MGMALYSLLLLGIFVFGAPYWLVRLALSGRYRAGLGGRLGQVPRELRGAVAGHRVVWLHAVSVGEVLAATRLVAELQSELGSPWIIVISTTTATGQALAQERFGASRVFWYPFDFAWAVRPFLRALRPELMVLMESELWPRMILECVRRGVPVAVVNARVSDRSYRRGAKIKSIWSRVLQRVTLFLSQSEEDARRLVQMGARPEAVTSIGNLKYDVRAPKKSQIADQIRHAAAGRPLVVAGSTVDAKPASEEQIFLKAAMGPVWQCYPDTLLVLAPRHPERFEEVFDLASHFGPTIRATDLLNRANGERLTEKIILLNTIGDLASVYGTAHAAFVGGSLVPRGGHNPLEPAQFGVPVVMGPSFHNFRGIVAEMQAAEAIFIVPDELACGEELINLLGRRPLDHEAGERGRGVFEARSGATTRAVSGLLALVKR